MGNCQAAEAATVVIQRPGGGGWTVERVYWSVPAREVMAANPGHYVAAITAVVTGPDGAPVRQLKLLRPGDNLTIGHVYRLVSFQEVLKEVAVKKKFAKLQQGKCEGDGKRKEMKSEKKGPSSSSSTVERRQHGENSRRGDRGGKHRQWKPALYSIAELGS